MAQIFHPATNTVAKVSIFGGILIMACLALAISKFNRSSYITQVGDAREQPVPFSHKHHVQGLGIDCRYCHSSVENSGFAGLPSTATCMNCHSVIWRNAPLLEPLRESFRTGKPLEWIRVHDLPDFVYFDHSIHIQKGIGCATCHGRVDQMPLTWRTQSLHMQWCLSCHRNPEKFIRPKEEVFNMDWQTPSDNGSMQKELIAKYHVQKLTNCTTCHR